MQFDGVTERPETIGNTYVWENDPWRGGAVCLSFGGMWRGVVVGLRKHDDLGLGLCLMGLPPSTTASTLGTVLKNARYPQSCADTGAGGSCVVKAVRVLPT